MCNKMTSSYMVNKFLTINKSCACDILIIILFSWYVRDKNYDKTEFASWVVCGYIDFSEAANALRK